MKDHVVIELEQEVITVVTEVEQIRGSYFAINMNQNQEENGVCIILKNRAVNSQHVHFYIGRPKYRML